MANSTDLVAQEEHLGMPASWNPNPFAGGKLMFSTLPQGTQEERLKVLKACGTADFKTDDLLGQEIVVKDVVCHVCTLKGDEEGEEVQAIRTILVDPQGSTAAFVSKGVFDSLNDLAFVFGPPPWPNGIKCRLVQQTTGRKRRVLKLDPIEEGK
jgi:hypothetical protein